MLNKIIRLFILAALPLFPLGSCNKSDSTTPKTRTQLLTQAPWIQTSYGLDENRDGVIDATEDEIQSCEKDDIITFSTNGSGSFGPGALTCYQGETITPFTWQFANNETEIDVLGIPLKILGLTETSLQFYTDDSTSAGQPTKFIVSLRH
jgi:hypothetical protein